VLPALIRKYHDAKIAGSKSVTNWGTGKPMREFLFVEDLADAINFLLVNINAKDLYDNGLTHINIGTGEDLTIGELAAIVAKVVGFDGETIYDSTKPDGTPRKLMDISRLHNLGWHHKTGLEEGIKKAYNWFLENVKN
jgi:GDP-L-fucose synthase